MKQGTEFVIDPGERATFDRRWQLRQALEGAAPDAAPSQEFASFYQSSLSMMTAMRLAETFRVPEERVRCGASTLGDSCILARNLVRSEGGTRFISISHNGWDLHVDMYDPKNKRNHYGLSRELDSAFSALLKDLARLRAKDGRAFGVTDGDGVKVLQSHWDEKRSIIPRP